MNKYMEMRFNNMEQSDTTSNTRTTISLSQIAAVSATEDLNICMQKQCCEINNIEDNIYKNQMIAYRLIKDLKQEKRETAYLNLIANGKWMEHHKELWYNPNIPQKAVEDIRENIDLITLEGVSSVKYQKAAGLDGVNSEQLNYFSTLSKFGLLYFLNMCWLNEK